MDAPSNEMERLFFFEHARSNAEAACAKNPLDADNLVRWGEALVELSQFHPGAESIRLMRDAISKLEEAVEINPAKADAHWHLGNANTSLALSTADQTAKDLLYKATLCYQQALEEDPGNELYKKSLDLSFKMPELHQQIQAEMSQRSTVGGSSASNRKVSKKKKTKGSNFTYDILGWVILAVGVMAWVGMKAHVPPPPPPV